MSHMIDMINPQDKIGIGTFLTDNVKKMSNKHRSMLLGEKATYPYRVIFCLFVGLGAISQLELVWAVSDIMNGLMAFPNLLALLFLAPIVSAETRRYLKSRDN